MKMKEGEASECVGNTGKDDPYVIVMSHTLKESAVDLRKQQTKLQC